MQRIIVDCTHTFHTGARTGIQRAVRQFADALLAIAARRGVQVVPARIAQGRLFALPIESGRVGFPTSGTAREIESPDPTHAAARVQRWRRWGGHVNRVVRSTALGDWLEAGPNADGLARHFASAPRQAPANALALAAGDILLSLDSSWVYDVRTVLENAGRVGATRVALLCDVLPLSDPAWFTDGTRRFFRGWLEALLPRLEGLATISRTTRDELERLVESGAVSAASLPKGAAVHLGAEIETTHDVEAVRPTLRAALAGGPPAFLTVGTLEPRKNVDFALDLFDHLLRSGRDVQWHIVGAPGWLADHTAQRIRGHTLFGSRLHWWTDLTDAELSHAYRHAAALVAVSRAEGFGLPLVEARLHGTPVFASDIPVFREVLGDEGRYLPLSSAPLAAAALEDFLDGRLPVPPRSTVSSIARSWEASAGELLDFALALNRRN